jgi:hypothetical protein
MKNTKNTLMDIPFHALYGSSDTLDFQSMMKPKGNVHSSLQSIEELLERDKLREKDGFPRKIKVGRLIKPGKGGKNKITIVPTTVEEKFMHDVVKSPEEEAPLGGSGEGEEGEVIGEQPLHEWDDAGAGGAGEGEGGSHEMESDAYELGKILTEQFQLPHLQNKGKKRSLTHYTHDLTDRNQGVGQLLDKKATIRKILDSNISLGTITDLYDIDTSSLIVAPHDKVYRILSKEKDYESQAIVFFVRDYSGSMWGNPTELIVSQHVLIYSWLLYQYLRQVETRFILHDTEAKEVPDFFTYYNSKVAGGTRIVSAYRLVNKIIEQESLYQDYNIYVFHGTDGDDWDTEGDETLPELRKILKWANRIGITIAQKGVPGRQSALNHYLKKSNLLREKSELLRVDLLPENANEQRLIEGIRHLTKESAPV